MNMCWLYFLVASTVATQTMRLDSTLNLLSASDATLAVLSPTQVSLMNDSLVITNGNTVSHNTLEINGTLKISTSITTYVFSANCNPTCSQLEIPDNTYIDLDDTVFTSNNMNMIADSPTCDSSIARCGATLVNTGFQSFSQGILTINLTGPANSFPNLRFFPYAVCGTGWWVFDGLHAGNTQVGILISAFVSPFFFQNIEASTGTYIPTGNPQTPWSVCSYVLLDKKRATLWHIWFSVLQISGATQYIRLTQQLNQHYIYGEGMKVVPMFI